MDITQDLIKKVNESYLSYDFSDDRPEVAQEMLEEGHSEKMNDAESEWLFDTVNYEIDELTRDLDPEDEWDNDAVREAIENALYKDGEGREIIAYTGFFQLVLDLGYYERHDGLGEEDNIDNFLATTGVKDTPANRKAAAEVLGQGDSGEDAAALIYADYADVKDLKGKTITHAEIFWFGVGGSCSEGGPFEGPFTITDVLVDETRGYYSADEICGLDPQPFRSGWEIN